MVWLDVRYVLDVVVGGWMLDVNVTKYYTMNI